MNKPTKAQLLKAQERASRVHESVCDVCYDQSRMNADGTCAECQNDLHELEIFAR